MGTGITGENTMRGRTTRTDDKGVALTGADIAGTGNIGTGRIGAVITGIGGRETGIRRAVTGPAVISGAGILPRPACTLPMSICRASTCTSCSHCNVGREIFGQLALWSVAHAHRSVLYRGRIR